ncbi:GNAT family N-acetyltransferase [Microbacterium sp. KUDC0406]|uniref:GNAT family N-acetyltransferase n=1 Tax=Microbacterium sp. KUDC0406 TaxID=2909588 RepID=UPI001F1873E0|nr:GNAT family N-acetyltransferase [Microbacterium sp. KUDC0406]UJP11425.1 GNAT family N-acetyltransferase [Microbacterium sp. KUDC0406]
MTLIDARSVAADPQSTARLADAGLEYRVVDMADATAGVAFARADARGFLDADPGEEQIARMREAWQDRRNIGVFEPGAVPEAFPVATVNSWVAPLTVPGGEVPMWAISSVTVAATHRRRGIARNLLEGELRSAASAGVPIAGLTVSEATIYSRYGFAPAIPVARVVIDPRRAGWIGVRRPAAWSTSTARPPPQSWGTCSSAPAPDGPGRSRAGSCVGCAKRVSPRTTPRARPCAECAISTPTAGPGACSRTR